MCPSWFSPAKLYFKRITNQGVWGKKKKHPDFHRVSSIYPYMRDAYITQVAQFYYKRYFPTCLKTLCKKSHFSLTQFAGGQGGQNLKIKSKFISGLLSAFQNADQEPFSEPSFWEIISSKVMPSSVSLSPYTRSLFLLQARRMMITSPSSINIREWCWRTLSSNCCLQSLAWVKICLAEVPSLFTQQKQFTEWQLASTVKRTRTHLSCDQEGAYLPDSDPHSLLINSVLSLSSETSTNCTGSCVKWFGDS